MIEDLQEIHEADCEHLRKQHGYLISNNISKLNLKFIHDEHHRSTKEKHPSYIPHLHMVDTE